VPVVLGASILNRALPAVASMLHPTSRDAR
jgi:hypothetical protein